jgi:hypothetical protein
MKATASESNLFPHALDAAGKTAGAADGDSKAETSSTASPESAASWVMVSSSTLDVCDCKHQGIHCYVCGDLGIWDDGRRQLLRGLRFGYRLLRACSMLQLAATDCSRGSNKRDIAARVI